MFDLNRWSTELHFDIEKNPLKSLKHHLRRLKFYFDVEERNGGYVCVPKSDINFTNQTYQTGEIFDTGSDIRRKQELRNLSESDLIDLILDHEQSITDREEEIAELKLKLEETETINQVKLESLEEENEKLKKGTKKDSYKTDYEMKQIKQPFEKIFSINFSLKF